MRSRAFWPRISRCRLFSTSARAREPVAHSAKRNELGVQLLSRELHGQLFKNVDFPPPESKYVDISIAHLKAHGLDPSQGSVLPDTAFTLPQLQGNNVDEHFHRIGSKVAEPWLSLSKRLADADLPLQPDTWDISRSGWTKYYQRTEGKWDTEPVDAPGEEMLAFDVETLPQHTEFAIMACAASPNAWYSWISPWLLQETDNAQQLISLGDPAKPCVVVGHNVSYDRIRVKEEYSLRQTGTRFIDTMALHVAVKGISSHQRPKWLSHRKSKRLAVAEEADALSQATKLMETVDDLTESELDPEKKVQFQTLKSTMVSNFPTLQLQEEDVEDSSKRWEDITSANGLADVAKLHCNIDVDKTIRHDFMKLSPDEIRESLQAYLGYCAKDVYVTHQVFQVVLPEFIAACPSPVSFAGILTMGSSFLPVNETWEAYIASAEGKYREMEHAVKGKLTQLAEEARSLMDSGDWKHSPWLSQLDWSPKTAGLSRGVVPVDVEPEVAPELVEEEIVPPAWYASLVSRGPTALPNLKKTVPLLLQCTLDDLPLVYSDEEGWHQLDGSEIRPLPTAKGKKVASLFTVAHGRALLSSNGFSSKDQGLFTALVNGDLSEEVGQRIMEHADRTLNGGGTSGEAKFIDPYYSHLDWTRKPEKKRAPKKRKPEKRPPVLWPKWYWEQSKPKKDLPPGSLDITPRNHIASILLRLTWAGYPLFRSREHGFTFRVPRDELRCGSGDSEPRFKTRLVPIPQFWDEADVALSEANDYYAFFKLPHKDGDKANVGSPLAKSFMKPLKDGILSGSSDNSLTQTDPQRITKDALTMNMMCSYWISARDRIMNQLVVWEDNVQGLSMGFPKSSKPLPGGLGGDKWGIIVPQMITMGAVTRRAIERTWLTASNAKKDRIGSELKSLIRAPPGYSIVGADVDSEELWIASCMGDSQFGLHGATALGWMTLEGTKAAGTDLHSKTASILGISRDQAKVFNYSRIYGAGIKHATLLLLQSSATILPDEASKRAQTLYASTKGKTFRPEELFGRKFWHGGSESYVFNKLEEIAMEARPTTPALGCGVTYALTREHLQPGFGNDYMPSRINWVVQSSGVDYLHLLIVAMDYLTAKYEIDARFLISVHDEVRYLVKEEDRYRAAMALQVANVWTRSLFAYKLGLDDLPMGVAFFSAVEVDTVLRKEVDMTCVTPSQPTAIPPGESLGISQTLAKTNHGSLWADGRAMETAPEGEWEGNLDGYTTPDCLGHRARGSHFLKAQATSSVPEILALAAAA